MVDWVNSDFEQIVSHYQRKLYACAFRILRNCEDAEEVVQDAFVRAHRALKSMPRCKRESLLLTPWLYLITRNVARSRLRTKHLPAVSLDAVAEFDLPSLQSSDRTPEVYMEQAEARELVEMAMRQMTEHLQSAARMRFVGGLSHVEIARQFRKPVGTPQTELRTA